MQKTKLFSVIILSIIFTLFLSANIAAAWDDCPFGFEDESYPGTCWRYVDTNGDGICDHSQSEPVNTEGGTEGQEQIDLQGKTNEGQSLLENRNTRQVVVMILSFFITLIAIVLTRVLVKKEILSKMKEKIIWNMLLLIFFLPSGITGIILVLMPIMPFLRETSLNFISLHSITSFFFMWISGYHIIWHTKYYVKGIKSLYKSNKK